MAIFAGGLLSVWLLFTQPILCAGPKSDAVVEPERLRTHVVTLAETYYPRDCTHVGNLDKCADYILGHFKNAGARTSFQEFSADGNKYRNVIGIFGPETGGRIVVGAHYDACGNTPGADDNASGVAVLIELAYMLSKNMPEATVELVAYTLEEPPFFGSPEMGSARHVASLEEADVDVKAMICLEMVGYFSDEPGSQIRPSIILKALYPGTGNFIGVVGRSDQRRPTRKIKRAMKGATDLPVTSINAPAGFAGIDLSDHRNYWSRGYDAVMITDTAIYRNRNYHGAGDTADSLDYGRMSKVTVQVGAAVKALAQK